MAEGKTGREVMEKLTSLIPADGKGWLDEKMIVYDPVSKEQMEVQTVVMDSKKQMTVILKR